MNKAVIDTMNRISKKVKKGEREGVVKCPFCDGEVHYIYQNAMSVRAKCNSCEFSIMA